MKKNTTVATEYKWIDKASKFLDSKFLVPGTNFRFGFDPLIGLIPGLGDITTFFASSVLVFAMARHGASGKVVALMTINILLDAIFGGIPILGSIFDVFFKANERNLKLLKRHHLEGKYQGSAKGVIIIVFVVLMLILSIMIYLFWKALVLFFGIWDN